MVLFFIDCKIYDLTTALFFAVSLGLLARQKFGTYYVLFPLACFNRETTILLTIFFMIYYLKGLQQRDWIAGIVYQGLVFILIRLLLMVRFARNGGTSFLFRPVENLAEHAASPWGSLLFLAGALITIWLCARHWHTKPLLLRTAFLVLAPALAATYLLFGWAFELRVFAELYPVAVALATWSFQN